MNFDLFKFLDREPSDEAPSMGFRLFSSEFDFGTWYDTLAQYYDEGPDWRPTLRWFVDEVWQLYWWMIDLFYYGAFVLIAFMIWRNVRKAANNV